MVSRRAEAADGKNNIQWRERWVEGDKTKGAASVAASDRGSTHDYPSRAAQRLLTPGPFLSLFLETITIKAMALATVAAILLPSTRSLGCSRVITATTYISTATGSRPWNQN